MNYQNTDSLCNSNGCGYGNGVMPTPPNEGLQIWNGQNFLIADGSSQNPISLPFLQQQNISDIQYFVGLTATGTFVLVPLSQIL